MSAPQTFASDRLQQLDLLRGLGILGILLVNVYGFGLPLAEFYQPGRWMPFEGADVWVWGLVALFAEWKFLTIFSLLFGAGIWIFVERAEARGDNAGALHLRRCAWLLLFGLLHAYLLWDGDILFSYGLCGMVLWPLCAKPARVQLIWSLALLVICSLLYFWLTSALYLLPDPRQLSDIDDPYSLVGAAEEVAAMRGNWLSQMPLRAERALTRQMDILLFGWRLVGLMLMGMVLVRSGWLSPRLFDRLPLYPVLLCLALGLLITGLGLRHSLDESFALEYLFVSAFQYEYWGSIFMALAYSGLVVYWCRSGRWLPLQRCLEAVGRTAFSCYILQTLICTSLFYGHGLGLFGQFDRLQLMGVALAVWAFLLWLAPWWLERFYAGPLEWLWRGLTYRQWREFRRPVT